MGVSKSRVANWTFLSAACRQFGIIIEAKRGIPVAEHEVTEMIVGTRLLLRAAKLTELCEVE
jgi:hypothetical protein